MSKPGYLPCFNIWMPITSYILHCVWLVVKRKEDWMNSRTEDQSCYAKDQMPQTDHLGGAWVV